MLAMVERLLVLSSEPAFWERCSVWVGGVFIVHLLIIVVHGSMRVVIGATLTSVVATSAGAASCSSAIYAIGEFQAVARILEG